MRTISEKIQKRNGCEWCAEFLIKKQQCPFNKCPYREARKKRASIPLETVFYKGNAILKNSEHISVRARQVVRLNNSGMYLTDIAEKLHMNPQEVVDIIEERRKYGIFQDL